MANAGILRTRIYLIGLLTVATIAIVSLLSFTGNVQASVASEPLGPATGEVWTPANNSTVTLTGSAQLVAYMVPPPGTGPFTITNVAFQVVSGIPPVVKPYSATYWVRPDYLYAVVTATNFVFNNPGQQASFTLTYHSQSDPNPTQASATYMVHGVFQTFAPALLKNYGTVSNAGNDPCSAVNASPLTDYATIQDNPYKFYSLSVPTTATVYLTSTNYPLPGQMQLRTYPTTGCAPTGTLNTINYTILPATPALAAFNVQPGTYLARFSSDGGATSSTPFNFRWQYIPGSGLFGANDDSCSAALVNLDTQYQEYPFKTEDWFAFDIAATQNISIGVNNYTAIGQIVLYQQTGPCSSIVAVDNAGFANGSAVIPPTSLTAGRYYLRVFTSGGNNATNLYNFTIYTVGTTWAPIANRCPQFVGCSDHSNTATSEIIYWDGAPGATEIKIEFKPDVVLGTCSAGIYQATILNASSTPTVGSVTPTGNYNVTGLTKGYYIVWVTISRPGFTTYVNTMGVKVNCDFVLLAQPVWGTPTVTPVAPFIGPLPPPAPKPTIPPLPAAMPEVKATPAP